jgi:hypothetical protein
MNKRRIRNVEPWKVVLQTTLPLLGHRNWIVVADSAYPSQSSPGIETIATEADHTDVLESTLRAIQHSKHVRANVYTDAELGFMDEEDAPGIERYRQELGKLIGDRETRVIPHEQIIEKLDQSAKLFRILILKSTLTLPYTSVFFELDCGYWTTDAERRLRLSMTQPQSATGKRERVAKKESRKS